MDNIELLHINRVGPLIWWAPPNRNTKIVSTALENTLDIVEYIDIVEHIFNMCVCVRVKGGMMS